MKLKFTKRTIEAIAPPASGREYHHDLGQDNLAICVSSAGTRTYYRVGRVGGRPVRVPVGKFPDLSVEQARKIVRRMNGEIASGKDPHADRQASRHEPTLGDLWDCWWNHAQAHKRPKSQAEDKRQWVTFLEGWRNRRLSSITRKEVAALHQRMGRDNGRYSANRVLSLLSAMWTEGRRAGLCEGDSPAKDIRRFHEEKRDRWLDGDELRRLLGALAEEETDVRDFFVVALLTGARRSNVQAMKWADLDLDLCLWTITAADAKAGEPMVIPLVKPAVEILRARADQADGCPWVFPGRGRLGHMVEPKRAWNRIRERAELPDVRIHDLRRTMGSWLATAGTSLQVIGKALGHRDLKSTATYARLGTEPVREATEKAAAKMLEAANGGEGGGR